MFSYLCVSAKEYKIQWFCQKLIIAIQEFTERTGEETGIYITALTILTPTQGGR